MQTLSESIICVNILFLKLYDHNMTSLKFYIILVSGPMSLGPGTQSLGLEHPSLDNKCGIYCRNVNLHEEQQVCGNE